MHAKCEEKRIEQGELYRPYRDDEEKERTTRTQNGERERKIAVASVTLRKNKLASCHGPFLSNVDACMCARSRALIPLTARQRLTNARF